MGFLTDQDLRDLLFAGAAIDLGYAKTHEVAFALQQALAGTGGEESIRQVLVKVARLDEPQTAAIDQAVARYLDAAAGDARAALSRAGGLPGKVFSQLAAEAPLVSQGLAAAGIAPKENLREAAHGRYIDFEPVGAGGFGIVYLALDTDLNREVAFKIVNPSVAAGQAAAPTPHGPSLLTPPAKDTPASQAFATLKTRFLQEALITSNLSHPSIVPVYEVGQTPEGVPYYTMKFVRGDRTFAAEIAAAKTLEDRLGLLEPFLDLCDAVAYAHERGVIHRDLKPENVKRGNFGETVLLDWGLARLKTRPDAAADARWRERIVQMRGETGLRTIGDVGTPGYMAPEALQDDPGQIDERSDQYSLGVILFQILTGKLPHEVDLSLDPLAAFNAYRAMVQSEDAPRADSVNRSVPKDLAGICARALARAATQRFGSVAELARTMRTWQSESVRRQRDAVRRAFVRRLVVEVTVLVLAAVGAFLWQRRKLAEQVQATYWQAYQRYGNGNPVGQLLVASAARDHAKRHRLHSGRSTRTGEYAPDWTYLAFQLLYACPRFAGEGHAGMDARQLTWGPGEELIVAGPTEVALWDIPTATTTRNLAKRWTDPNAALEQEMVVSPTATLLAYSGPDFTVTLRHLKGDRPETRLAGHKGRVTALAFSPDETALASSSEDGTVRLWDVPSAEMRALTEATGVSHLAFSPLGSLLVTGGEAPVIALLDPRDLRTVEKLSGLAAATRAMAFAGNGQTLATANADGTVRIWDVPAQRQTQCVYTWWPGARESPGLALRADGSIAAWDCHPPSVELWYSHYGVRWQTLAGAGRPLAFSRDGMSLIAYGQGNLRVWDLAGLKDSVGLGIDAPGLGQPSVVCFSVDGLAFAVRGGQTSRVVVILESATGRELSRFGAPDGVSAFCKAEPWVLPYSTRLCGMSGMAFGPDGVFVVAGAEDGSLVVHNRTTGQTAAVRTGAGGSLMCVCFSADGRYVASGGSDGAVRLWQASDWRQVRTIAAHSERVRCLAISPDGSLLASSGEDGMVKLWALPGGTLLHSATPFSPVGIGTGAKRFFHGPWSLSFNPSGSRLAAGGGLRAVALYDTATGQEVPYLPSVPPWVGEGIALFAPDDATLVTAAMDDEICFLDAKTRQLRGVVRHGGPVLGLSIGAATRICTSVSRDGVHWWDLTALTSLDDVEGLTGCRLDKDLNVVRATARPGRDLNWGPFNPNRWIPGARRGEARSLYELGVIRERQRRDGEARGLHLQAAAVTDPQQQEWAEKSRQRLATIPWLRNPEHSQPGDPPKSEAR